MQFKFIVDTGKGLQDTASIKEESNRLVKYFLAGLTIPEGELWVNLSPYEKDRITTRSLGQTILGRDLLAQDYILKQLTASLIYPQGKIGREFWSRVYAKAQKEFGTTNVPINTFNKVWILPDEAQVYEHGSAAYVTKSTLKVMLDEDYLAMKKHTVVKNGTDSISSQIVRQIVLPEITKEVNTGKNFAPLRQIYDAMILAKWYKQTMANGLLDALYTNKNKTAGVNLADPAVKEQIYQRYIKAYKKGVFNYIKETPTSDGQVVPRKYFSGGITKLEPDHVSTDGQTSAVRSDGAMISLTIAIVAAGTIGAMGLGAKGYLEKALKKAQKEKEIKYKMDELWVRRTKERIDEFRARHMNEVVDVEAREGGVHDTVYREKDTDVFFRDGTSITVGPDSPFGTFVPKKGYFWDEEQERWYVPRGGEFDKNGKAGGDSAMSGSIVTIKPGDRIKNGKRRIVEVRAFKIGNMGLKPVYEYTAYDQFGKSYVAGDDLGGQKYKVGDVVRTRKQNPDAAMLKSEIAQREADRAVSAITGQSIKSIQAYRSLGLSSLLMPLNLKMTAVSAQTGDAIRFLSKHPLWAAGMTKTDMAMISEIWQWASSHPYWAEALTFGTMGAITGFLGRLKEDNRKFQEVGSLIWGIPVGGTFFMGVYPISLSILLGFILNHYPIDATLIFASAYVIPISFGMPMHFISSVTKDKAMTSEKTSKRILLVDDSQIMRETVKDSLMDYGNSVVTAVDGRDALKKLAASSQKPFDLVLTDTSMPKMDGIDLIIALKKAHNKIPIIIWSSDPDLLAARIEARKLKPEDAFILDKSTGLDELDKVINRLTGPAKAASASAVNHKEAPPLASMQALREAKEMDPDAAMLGPGTIFELTAIGGVSLAVLIAIFRSIYHKSSMSENIITILSRNSSVIDQKRSFDDLLKSNSRELKSTLWELLENSTYNNTRLYQPHFAKVALLLGKLGDEQGLQWLLDQEKRMNESIITYQGSLVVHPNPNLAEVREAIRILESDRAMLQTPRQAINKAPGGIDLNQIAVKRTGKTIKMRFDPGQLDQLEQGGFEGFKPVIINITPISSPFQLLGVDEAAQEPQVLAKV
ncbi:MAG: response regulator [Candidatus Omnitrophica bacterium]|nr:response regulator [Candidatus Omnitrophota bacterium]